MGPLVPRLDTWYSIFTTACMSDLHEVKVSLSFMLAKSASPCHLAELFTRVDDGLTTSLDGRQDVFYAFMTDEPPRSLRHGHETERMPALRWLTAA